MLRTYFAGNIMTVSHARDGFLSLQSLALACIANVPSGTMTITLRDAARAGFRVTGAPVFETCATNGNVRAGHAQFLVAGLVQEAEIVGQSSRVRKAVRDFVAFDAEARHAIVARHNARRASMAAKVGPCASALLALLPREDCLRLAIIAHDPAHHAHDSLRGDWLEAVAWLNAHPTALHL